jgi:hypothetical protein
MTNGQHQDGSQTVRLRGQKVNGTIT